MVRSLGRVLGPLGAALVMTTTFTGMAQAANFPMDGDHAYQHGCRADQEVIYHTYIRDTSGNLYGYIDLMYSPKCVTTWAHAHADIAGTPSKASSSAITTGRHTSAAAPAPPTAGLQWCTTRT